jgi:hypothetical protein
MRFMSTPQTLDPRKVNYRLGSLFACFTLAVLTVPASANADTDAHDSISSLRSVADSELDRLRGGFRTPKGLEISFGIRKLTLINGQIFHDSSFNAHDSMHNTGNSEKHHAAINFRPGITVTTLLDNSRQLSLIQNNLNNQRIQNILIVDLRISNLLTLHSSLSRSRWIAESARDF